MRTRRFLFCVAALGLFTCFSCAAHSREATQTESAGHSGNANANAADGEKKVSVAAGGDSVEVKSSDGNTVSAGNGSVEVKSANGKSVSVSAGGIAVSNSDEDSEEVSADDVVKIAGVNQDLSHDCKGRSFSISGTSNTVKLAGQCQNLKVSGTSNQVDVETVAAINVSGIRNQVTWERGVKNKPPSISNSGINNTVYQKGK